MYRPGYFHHHGPDLGRERLYPATAPQAAATGGGLRRAMDALRHGFRTALDSGHVAIALSAGNPVAALVLNDLAGQPQRGAAE